MKSVRRKHLSAVALFGCALLCGSAATTRQEPPCNRVCTAAVSLTPASGICTTNGGGCGPVGMKVVVTPTDGQCAVVGPLCTGACSFVVRIEYSTGNGSCNCVDVTGTECGTNVSYLCQGNCPGSCVLHSNTYSVTCGANCALSYVVRDQTNPTGTCSVAGTLSCDDPCP
jgi:hypothetical protein